MRLMAILAIMTATMTSPSQGGLSGTSLWSSSSVAGILSAFSGCPDKPRPGALTAGFNVPGWVPQRTSGPDECARLCGKKEQCAGWTQHVSTNYCHLKISLDHKNYDEEWIHGPPCNEEEDTCGANRVEGIYCLNGYNEISCQMDKHCPPPESDETIHCRNNICSAIGKCRAPFGVVCNINPVPLTFSSPAAGQTFRFASGLYQQLAEKTQCKKTTPCSSGIRETNAEDLLEEMALQPVQDDHTTSSRPSTMRLYQVVSRSQ